MSQDPILAADHVSKWYGQVIGLNDVTLTVPAGITGLLGPNGAGKSTFMKLVTGQLKPSQGRLSVLGEEIWRNPALYFRIGFCPEQDAFYDWMTGLEWLTALVRLDGVGDRAAAEMAARALALVDLTDAGDKKIGAYSKGMRQRVKLAQALAHDPELLILDEPLAGMDPIARRKTIRLIRRWGQSGKSVLVSSHVLHEIEAMTSNILLIHQGRILAEGNVHQIRDLIDEHPHTVFIKADETRALAREFLGEADVLSLRFEDQAVVVQTARPDAFYARLTAVAASGEFGAIHEVSSPDDNLQAVFQYPGEGMMIAERAAPRPSLIRSALRIFDLSLGQMLWSRRSVFLAVLVGGPVLLGAAIRMAAIAEPLPRINGAPVSGPALFGMAIWLLYVRVIVPVLGVFYGTALIADEIDDKTITYLFTRPLPRSAVLLGKYLSFLTCTILLVLPSVVAVYFLVVPLNGGSIGAAFPLLLADLGMLAVGLTAYGAVFALVGARLKRPLVIGLVFAFGWEPGVLLFPGYLKRATVAYYLQALVPHAMPQDSAINVLMQMFYEVPTVAVSLAWLCGITVAALWWAGRAVERREYVLEQ